MKINNISPQINFKQVIQINIQSGEAYNHNPYENANKELTNILNNKKSNFYSKDEAKKIKTFFDSFLGKDNKNIALEYCDLKKFLTTGQQSKELSSLDSFVEQTEKINPPKIKSRAGIITVSASSAVSNLRKTAIEFWAQVTKGILEYSDDENKNTSITMKSKEGEERFSLFEYTKKDANGEVIETKTLDLNA